MVTYTWRGDFENPEVNRLHAEAFDHPVYDDGGWDWHAQVERHSLGWVTARDGAEAARSRGLGKELVAIAVSEARRAGCEWLHVDFEDHLRDVHFETCGFAPSNAGLIAL